MDFPVSGGGAEPCVSDLEVTDGFSETGICEVEEKKLSIIAQRR